MVELTALMAAPIAELMASHMLEAVELTAPHTVSHAPWMTQRAAPITSLTYWMYALTAP